MIALVPMLLISLAWASSAPVDPVCAGRLDPAVTLSENWRTFANELNHRDDPALKRAALIAMVRTVQFGENFDFSSPEHALSFRRWFAITNSFVTEPQQLGPPEMLALLDRMKELALVDYTLPADPSFHGLPLITMTKAAFDHIFHPRSLSLIGISDADVMRMWLDSSATEQLLPIFELPSTAVFWFMKPNRKVCPWGS